MKVDVLLGLQWGDEGKGKIVDVITPGYDAIARFQGGPNAGHTLEFNDEKYILHTIPSGIFHKNTTNIVGNGVVVDPVVMEKELEVLSQNRNFNLKNLKISLKTHLILPTHRVLDAAQEKAKGKKKIGSTLKGIGPTYTDKFSRNGIRIGDLYENNFNEKYQMLKEKHLQIIDNCGFDYKNHKIDGYIFEEYENKWFQSLETIKTIEAIASEYEVNELINNNKRILAEGAQGSLLDIDFGSYPYVTSSNTICAGVGTGLGIAPGKIGEVYGIFKAYCTRVGSGPFPTELNNKAGDKLRDAGNEYGSTTGRPRRCGWLDLVALKYTVMLNGITKLIMTKADVLSNLGTLKICTHYKHKNILTNKMPFDIDGSQVTPVYKIFKGWKADISKAKTFKELPAQLISYINYLEKELNVPIEIISVGPNRDETVLKSKK